MDCYPREIFISKPYLDNLTCTIGLGIFNNPVALPCQHVFCKYCIEQWHAKTGTCPKCREKFDKESMRPQWVIKRIIENSPVRCTNENCKWTGPQGALCAHVLSDCSETVVKCPMECGKEMKRANLQTHLKDCPQREVQCGFCELKIKFKDKQTHEASCLKNVVVCPNGCGKSLPAPMIELHSKEECTEGKRACKFAKTAGCTFVGDKTALADHYAASIETHMMALATAIRKLQEKVEAYERAAPFVPAGLPAVMNGSVPHAMPALRPIPITWSNGSTRAAGTVNKGWSFFLTSLTLKDPFIARVRVASLNTYDTNTWKICLGVFNSSKVTVGSWTKHKNGWGYIVGTGEKVSTLVQPYSEASTVNDVITIQCADKSVSFYRNATPLGIAFTPINGPFYLAVALADAGHSVEIVEVDAQSK